MIKLATYEDMAGNEELELLIGEYADECSINGLPPPNPHWPTYEALAKSGLTHILVAYDEHGYMKGFALMLTALNPHYGVKLAVCESLFVSFDGREKGLGVELTKAVEEKAKAEGCAGLLLSAPVGGQLAAVLERKKAWTETNRVFFKPL